MPQIFEDQTKDYSIIIWKIAEDADFFLDKVKWNNAELDYLNSISYEGRKLQFVASRFLIKTHLGENTVVYKDDCGCPQAEKANISISHTNEMACIIISKNKKVGIDLEPIHPKVKRIKYKFLTEDELSFISSTKEVEHLITCWSTKETVFKWYSKGNLPFKNNMKILPFKYKKDGRVKVNLNIDSFNLLLNVQYKTIENHLLTYVLY